MLYANASIRGKTEGVQVSRAEFEENLCLKRRSPVFNSDIGPLLTTDQLRKYQMEEAYELLFRDFLPKLNGAPWKNLSVD